MVEPRYAIGKFGSGSSREQTCLQIVNEETITCIKRFILSVFKEN